MIAVSGATGIAAGAVTDVTNVSFGIAFASGEPRSCAWATATPHEQPDQTIIPAVAKKRRNMADPRTQGCHHVFVRSRHASARAARPQKGKACARDLAKDRGWNHPIISAVFEAFRICRRDARRRPHELRRALTKAFGPPGATRPSRASTNVYDAESFVTPAHTKRLESPRLSRRGARAQSEQALEPLHEIHGRRRRTIGLDEQIQTRRHGRDHADAQPLGRGRH